MYLVYDFNYMLVKSWSQTQEKGAFMDASDEVDEKRVSSRKMLGGGLLC